MNGVFVFEKDRFVRDAIRIFGEELAKAGEKVVNLMKIEVNSNEDSRHDWREEAMNLIKTKTEVSTDYVISQLTGIIDMPDNMWQKMRINILEYGNGSESSWPGSSKKPVQHIQGKAGINDDVTGYAAISYKESYNLPVTWNHAGSHWFEKAIGDGGKLADELFDEAIERAWGKFNPMDYIVLA